MNYIYSKWSAAPAGYPTEFYSELDARRFEIRKIEIYNDGKIGYASHSGSTLNTRLSTTPVPNLIEIQRQTEFETRGISLEEFEQKWREHVIE